jgi:hypothetical protein
MQPTFPQPGPAPGNQPSAITGRHPDDDREAAQRAELASRSTWQRWLVVGLVALGGVMAVWWIVAIVLSAQH